MVSRTGHRQEFAIADPGLDPPDERNPYLMRLEELEDRLLLAAPIANDDFVLIPGAGAVAFVEVLAAMSLAKAGDVNLFGRSDNIGEHLHDRRRPGPGIRTKSSLAMGAARSSLSSNSSSRHQVGFRSSGGSSPGSAWQLPVGDRSADTHEKAITPARRPERRARAGPVRVPSSPWERRPLLSVRAFTPDASHVPESHGQSGKPNLFSLHAEQFRGLRRDEAAALRPRAGSSPSRRQPWYHLSASAPARPVAHVDGQERTNRSCHRPAAAALVSPAPPAASVPSPAHRSRPRRACSRNPSVVRRQLDGLSGPDATARRASRCLGLDGRQQPGQLRVNAAIGAVF